MLQHPIAILGSGPIGLEAALYARHLKRDVILLERGEIAANVAAWGFVRLFSPWRMNVTPLGMQAIGPAADLPLDACATGQELRERYLLPISRSPLLGGCIRTQNTVLSIGREDFHKADQIGKPARAGSPFRILVRDAQGRERIEHASVVLDCTGTYSHHRYAGVGGIPAPGELALAARIGYTIPDVLGRDRAAFADRHTLLVGCGYSAATFLRSIAQLVEDHPRTRVTWAIRRPGAALHSLPDDPLAQREALVAAMLKLTHNPPRWLTFHPSASLESIRAQAGHFHAILRTGDGSADVDCDEVVTLVGYSPDSSLYEQLQIHQCYATAGPIKLAAALLGSASTDCLTAGNSLTADTLKNPEPGFFILGAKSYGTNSSFLLQTGHRQIRDVFQLIEQNPDLNLYRA